MKYVKILGLLAVAAAAMMAFAVTASATTLTNSTGGTYGVGQKIHADSEGTTTLDGPATISCGASTVEGEIGNAGGSKEKETVSGSITTLTFSNCNQHVTVLAKGSLEAHTKTAGTTDGNGTLTSSGAEVQAVITSLGLTCVYTTENTDIGTLTGSKNTGGTATLDIDSSPIPRTKGSFFCGTSAEWTGSYSVDNPMYVDVD